jgi:DNA-3-methyladenine glycosylase II
MTRLPVAPPFSLEETTRALQRLPANQVEVWRDGTYHRLLRLDDRDLALRITQPAPGTIEVEVEGAPLSPELAGRVAERVRWMLALDVDVAAFRARAAPYPPLAELAARLAGMRPPRFPTLFESLLNAVLFQQISLVVGVSMLNRLAVTFGAGQTVNGISLYRLPTPTELLRLSEADLRGISVSSAKARSLLALAASLEAGELEFDRLQAQEDAALEEALVRHRGIGPWTAQVVMLRGFGRLSVFPPGDSGATGALRRFFSLSDAEASERIAGLLHDLADLRGYLYFCLLGWRLMQRGVMGEEGCV